MIALLAVLLTGCTAKEGPVRDPLPEDTGDATVVTVDTATITGTEDEIPDHLLTISQSGTWSMSPLGGPFTDIAGTLLVQEYVDELDLLKPIYQCDVTYTLTGQAAENHSCGDCDFVFDVEFFVNEGNPDACREPDTPRSGNVWRMGYDPDRDKLLVDYGGTGVWVSWMDANLTGSDLTFVFEKVVAVQVEEEEE
jgi:hypothetical protein